MKKTLRTNTLMDELLFSDENNLMNSRNIRKIKAEINDFFANVRLYENDEEKCFSPENYFERKSFESQKLILPEFEWYTNEIYLDRSDTGRFIKEALKLAIETVEQGLKKQFSGNSFVITASVQFGEMQNINMKICLDRGYQYSVDDLDGYDQPVLEEFFTP